MQINQGKYLSLNPMKSVIHFLSYHHGLKLIWSNNLVQTLKAGHHFENLHPDRETCFKHFCNRITKSELL